MDAACSATPSMDDDLHDWRGGEWEGVASDVRDTNC